MIGQQGYWLIDVVIAGLIAQNFTAVKMAGRSLGSKKTTVWPSSPATLIPIAIALRHHHPFCQMLPSLVDCFFSPLLSSGLVFMLCAPRKSPLSTFPCNSRVHLPGGAVGYPAQPRLTRPSVSLSVSVVSKISFNRNTTMGAYMRPSLFWASWLLNNFSNFCPLTTFDS